MLVVHSNLLDNSCSPAWMRESIIIANLAVAAADEAHDYAQYDADQAAGAPSSTASGDISMRVTSIVSIVIAVVADCRCNVY